MILCSIILESGFIWNLPWISSEKCIMIYMKLSNIVIVLISIQHIQCSKSKSRYFLHDVDIELCKTNIVGQPCLITCKIPDFASAVAFFHPPGELVATCPDVDSCLPKDHHRYKMVIEKEKKQITLIILKLNEILHSGYWLCTYGGARSHQSNLVVHEMPKSKSPTLYLTPFEGDSLTLNCDLDIPDAFDVTWYKNDRHYDNERFLVLKDIDDSAKGNYICSASFNDGRFTKNGSFINIYTVQKRRKEPEKEPEMVPKDFFLSAEEGQSMTFKCDLDWYVNDKNNIQWTFNGERVNEQNGKITVTEKGMLNIEDISQHDLGKYTCHQKISGFNEVGQDLRMTKSVIYSLNVVYKPNNKDKNRHFGFNCVWLGAYIWNIIAAYFAHRNLSPNGYYMIFNSLFVYQDHVQQKKLRILKWWILMSPLFIILMYPSHVTDAQDVMAFILPSALWFVVVPINRWLYNYKVKAHVKKQDGDEREMNLAKLADRLRQILHDEEINKDK